MKLTLPSPPLPRAVKFNKVYLTLQAAVGVVTMGSASGKRCSLGFSITDIATRAPVKPKRKTKLVGQLARSLSAFYPALANRFACPTCLRSFPTVAAEAASDAHIIPRSAGGRVSTIICRRCNSQFGMRQDKWFGEHLYLRSKKKPLLATRHQLGRLKIAGVPVGGEVLVDVDGTTNILMHTDRTAPDALRRVLSLAKTGTIQEISVEVPLLKKAWLIPFGFLTAAYLLWFRELGYSFAFQRHLDAVRALIQKPDIGRLPRNAILHCADKHFHTPWIGLGTFHGRTVLLAGLADRIVLLPSHSSPQLYEELDSLPTNGALTDYEVVQMYEDHQFGGPVGVMHRKAFAVLPDIAFRRSKHPEAILRFPGDGAPAQLLHTITAEQAAEALKQPNAEYSKTSLDFSNAAAFTGESGGEA